MRLKLIVSIVLMPFLFLQAEDVFMGQGCTTAFHIDKDCDGFGIGPGLKGPDADDNDPSVNSTASVQEKYGTIRAFLEKVKGYHATRFWIIDPNGNNATCSASPDLATAEAKPCHTLRNDGKADGPYEKRGVSGLNSGDVVLWKKGTFEGRGNFYLGSQTSGTKSKPLIFMAYPGADVKFSNDYPTFSLQKTHYLIIDGMQVDETPANYHSDGIQAFSSTGLIFRNNWIHGSSNGMMLQYDMHDLLIEQNVISDSRGSHCIYMGQNADHDGGGRAPAIDPPNPNSNITVRDNVVYRCGSTHIQHNGAVTNLLIERNIVHSSHLVMNAIALLDGVTNSVVRNNIVFNVWGSAVQIYTYDDDSLAIWPRSQHDILVEGNTLVSNCYNGDTESFDAGHCAAQIAIQDSSGAQLPMRNFTFRNNYLIGSGRTGKGVGGHLKLTRYAGDGDPTHSHGCKYGENWTVCTGNDAGLDPTTSILPTLRFEGNTIWPAPSDGVDIYIRNSPFHHVPGESADKNLAWHDVFPKGNFYDVKPQFVNYTPPNSTTAKQDFRIKSSETARTPPSLPR